MKEDHTRPCETPVQRLLVALDLMEAGVDLMRQNIARKLPHASKETIDAELNRWLMEQPKNFTPRDISENE